jgi:hypothetical protein
LTQDKAFFEFVERHPKLKGEIVQDGLRRLMDEIGVDKVNAMSAKELRDKLQHLLMQQKRRQ